eukprot:9211002-Alexandrium_andersonii.AAC.1
MGDEGGVSGCKPANEHILVLGMALKDVGPYFSRPPVDGRGGSSWWRAELLVSSSESFGWVCKGRPPRRSFGLQPHRNGGLMYASGRAGKGLEGEDRLRS